MVSLPVPGASDIPTYRTASVAAGALATIVLAAWLALTWDALLTNFQVRWMCDEDRGYVLATRKDADSIALPDASLADPRVLPAYAEAFPSVAAASTTEGRAARYALVDKWPKTVRSYWGYSVVRSDLSVVERPRDFALGTSGLFRRVSKPDAPLADLRARFSPPPELCTPADRIEFVKRVLRPPA